MMKAYGRLVKDQGTYANFPELWAFAHKLNYKLCVYERKTDINGKEMLQFNREPFHRANKQNGRERFAVLYTGGNHYEGLVFKSEDGEEEAEMVEVDVEEDVLEGEMFGQDTTNGTDNVDEDDEVEDDDGEDLEEQMAPHGEDNYASTTEEEDDDDDDGGALPAVAQPGRNQPQRKGKPKKRRSEVSELLRDTVNRARTLRPRVRSTLTDDIIDQFLATRAVSKMKL